MRNKKKSVTVYSLITRQNSRKSGAGDSSKRYNLACENWPQAIKVMFNSTEHVIFHAHKCLPFISLMNTSLDSLKAKQVFIFRHFL